MEFGRIARELALQIEAEMERGIRFWSEPTWNEAARSLLAPALTATTGAAEGSRPSAVRQQAGPPAPENAGPTPAAVQPPKRPSFGPPPKAEGRARDWKKQLAELGQEAATCTRCSLAKTRTHVVFNSGSGKVPLVFVGEAPGANEDAEGEAFVGRAGQLLTKIIAAIGLNRKDVYICNVLKCRPPGNRNPMPGEIESCSPFLMKQFEILKPRVICTLGLFATQLLLDTKAPIGKLRGRVFSYGGVPLLPTYHPAALLRNPNLKRTVWEDVQLLRRVLDEGPEKAGVQVQLTEQPRRPAQPASGDLFA